MRLTLGINSNRTAAMDKALKRYDVTWKELLRQARQALRTSLQ
jgi:hypothetical protein